jgi:hypothetical protein
MGVTQSNVWRQLRPHSKCSIMVMVMGMGMGMVMGMGMDMGMD